jgi:hypothetical protein
MLRSLALALALVVLAPLAYADKPSPTPRPSTTTMHYPTLEKLLRKFSRQAGEASRGKTYAQR